ncbi:arginine-tRNA--protein transferase 1 [Atractiella rhizophila]|nr:arginine-tRNA--protein transferase 1 [Atractiella rhizophila]
MEALSILTPLSYHASSCGYCSTRVSPSGNKLRSEKKSSLSYGMWAHRLSPQMYQSLIDRGWRRSGHYLYHPDMDRTCCPQYAIRLLVEDFKPSKSMRRVINRFNRFLIDGGKDEKTAKDEQDVEMDVEDGEVRNDTAELERAENLIGKVSLSPAALLATTVTPALPSAPARTTSLKSTNLTAPPNLTGKATTPNGGPVWKPGTKGKAVFDLRASINAPSAVANPVHTLRTELIASDSEDHFEERYSLYKDYQMSIHNEGEDKVTERGFRRFLCESPIIPQPLPSTSSSILDGSTRGNKFGSHHLLYWLDGVLIALAVLDILPKGVSSVYFCWRNEYARYRMGKYSAMREIALVKELGLSYYVMGYYIHNCQKMRYKGQYSPSELLDPDTNTFYPLSTVIPLLEQSLNASFSSSPRTVRLSPNDTTQAASATSESSEVSSEDSDDEEPSLSLPLMPGSLLPNVESAEMRALLPHVLSLEPTGEKLFLAPLEVSKVWNMEGSDEKRRLVEGVAALGELVKERAGRLAFYFSTID